MATRDQLLQALKAADAAGAADDARKLAAMIASMPKEAPVAPPEPELTTSRVGELLSRGAIPAGVGAIAGGAMGSVAGPPGMAAGAIMGGLAVPAADALAGVYNYGAEKLGGRQITPPSQAISQLMADKLGFEPGANTGERVIEAAGGALTGAAGEIPAAATLARTAASPTTRAVATQMATAPRAQMAAAPVSAGVGQAVSEETDSPMAGTAAALLTGAGMGAASSGRTRPATPPAQTRAQIAAQSRAAYDRAQSAGVIVDRQPFQDFVQGTQLDLENSAFDRGLHPHVSRVLERFQEEVAQPQQPMTLERLEILRRIANNAEQAAVRGGDRDEARIAGRVVDRLDDFVDNLDQSQLIHGDPDVAVPALHEARTLWRRNAKMQTVEGILDKAEALNDPNFVKQQFRSIVKNDRRMRQFTPTERGIVRRIARTGTLEGIGRLAPSLDALGAVKGAMYAGAGLASPGTLAVPAVALGAKYIARAQRVGNVRELQDTIARGGQAPPRTYFRRPGATALQVGAPSAAREAAFDVEPEVTPEEIQRFMAQRAQTRAGGR